MNHQELTRREFLRLASTGVALAAFGVKTLGEAEKTLSPLTLLQNDNLRELFIHPPDEAHPRCYWYWMNGNITREGILADLDALAEIGVCGVNYFDIGLLPAGTVVNHSPEWFEIVKYAVVEAAKRNIKVSFNCPGWSGSGGPWITPERSMQELTWSETCIEGGQNFSSILQQPPTRLNYYRDIAVLAFPSPTGDNPLPIPHAIDMNGNPLPQAIFALTPRTVLADHLISQAPGVPSADAVSPEDIDVADLPATFDLVFPHTIELRSVYIHGTRKNGSFKAQLLAWDNELESFRPVAQANSHTGGPFSDHLASAGFPAIKSAKFRLVFENGRKGQNIQLEKLIFSGGFRVTDWQVKAGFSSDPVNPAENDNFRQEGDIISLDRMIDLTDRTEPNGKLTWQAPPNEYWTIIRIGYTPTGVYLFPTSIGGAGLDCDKMSREAADFHYDHCVKPFLEECGNILTGRDMVYYHVDSYESGWQNWTSKFPDDFRERRGYDLLKYMPALTGRVVENLETTERFLWDFRRTIGDLFADNNYGRLAERCHEDGIRFSTEPYGGPFEQLQVGLRADHPMTEIWIQHPIHGRNILPQAVMSGHTAGRKRIGAEIFTSGPPYGGMWGEHPFSLKPLGDFAFCSGVNQYCIHVSTHQPLLDEHLRPGFTCGQNGIHFDRGEIWLRHGGKEWVTYLSRCQALLQAGEHVADILYFQGNDSPYGVYPFESELPEGYAFDACGGETLKDTGVQNGRIVLKSGKNYRYLVLPDHGRITFDSLSKIVSLAHAGAQIVGAIPQKSPSLADAAHLNDYEDMKRELAEHLRTQSLSRIFADDNLPPDFSYNKNCGMVLHAIHHTVEDTDFFFVANSNSDKDGVAVCFFRITGKTSELYHADTGVIESNKTYKEIDGITQIPLHFDPAGSIFVVFRPRTSNSHPITVSRTNDISSLASVPTLLESVPINTPWALLFPPGWGAPEKIMLDKLISFPEHSDPGVRYFSGTAIYKTTFPTIQIASNRKLFLNLGRVEVIAELWLNGRSLGTLWKPPFVCEITGLLRPKMNELEIHVTNLWPNRLIGDEQFPDDCTEDGRWDQGPIPAWPKWLKEGQPRPESRRLTFCTWKHWHKNDPLLPSGLLGPVSLQQIIIK